MNKPALSDFMVEKEAEAARDLLHGLAATVADDEDFAHDVIEGETSLLEAIERAISDIRECDVIEAGCKAEIDTLSSRMHRAIRRRDTIRAAIEQAMVTTGQDTIRTATKTLTIARRPGKAVVTDEAEIPTEFWKPQPPKLDKTALNKAVQNQTVPGAHLGNGTISLTIRSK